MSQQATMVRAQHANQLRARMPKSPEPAFPWIVHRFNPSVPPLEPAQIRGEEEARVLVPIMWFNQCRDCFGWVDDPRHS